MSRTLVVTVLAVATASAAIGMCQSAASDPLPMRSTMHKHFRTLDDVHRALLRSDLRTAKRRAGALARLAAPGVLPGWEEYAAAIRKTAMSLSRASSSRRARQLLATAATQCGDCHEESADVSLFVWPAEPLDDGSPQGRMARHQWAAESVWMGLVGPSEERWQDGLEVLAEPPLLPEAYTDDRAHHDEVERYSRLTATLAARAGNIDSDEGRAGAFAELLGACAGCHAATRPRP